MDKNLASNTNTEKVLEENYFFILSESKIIFKNDNQRLSLHLDQISNIRLIKKRDFTVNIIVAVFSSFFYIIVLHPVNFNTIFQYLIAALLGIFVIVGSLTKNYSYKLLINKNNYDYNEIVVSKKNLYFAKIFLNKFPASSLTKNNAKQKFVFDYQNLEKHVA